MKTFAYIVQGVVWEIIPPRADAAGNEISIAQRYTPEYVAMCVDITDLDPQPQQDWTYANGEFAPLGNDNTEST